MNNPSIVEVELQELIERTRNDIEDIKTESDKKIAQLSQRLNVLEEALRTYSEMKGTEPTQATELLTKKDVEGKTYREILRTIALRNEKLLIVRHAVRRMKELNVFGNASYPESIVYSTLNRNSEFKKVGRGAYKLNGDDMKSQIRSRSRGETSGVTKVIREMKEANPKLTKNDVLRYLFANRFDFKGRKPINAVTMAWVSLGYSKEGKQQPLSPNFSVVSP